MNCSRDQSDRTQFQAMIKSKNNQQCGSIPSIHPSKPRAKNTHLSRQHSAQRITVKFHINAPQESKYTPSSFFKLWRNRMVYVGLCDNGMIAFARSCFFCGLWVAFDSPFLWFVVLLDSAVSLFFMSSVVSFCQNL
jgi:hypothetical protein